MVRTSMRVLRRAVFLGLVTFLLASSGWSLPRTPPPACGAGLRLMSANLLMVNPDPEAITAELTASNADVLALQEYSPRWEEALAPLRRTYPYRVDRVQEDSFGTALWSRVPMSGAQIWPIDGLPQSKGTVSIGAGQVEIWNIHVLPPRTWEYAKAHAEEMDLLRTAMELQEGALVVTGDFNASAISPFHHRVTRFVDDAWSLLHLGGGATWPNGVFPLPPMRLDHVYMTRDLTVADVQIGVGEHSDHRPLTVELRPRAGGGLCR